MNELKNKVPVAYLCKYFGVTRSTFYSKKLCKYEGKKSKIYEDIKKVFTESKSTYGSPRVCRKLNQKKIQISENTVAKYMSNMGLNACLKKKYRPQLTDSSHCHPIAPRVFKTEESSLPHTPGKLLAGDITYLKLGKKFIYLAIVMDLYNREIVGWSIGKNLESTLVLNALRYGLKKVSKDSRIIFHSDRGSQYASQVYRDFLSEEKIIPSMSRKGNCYDNAFVESWFASLKKEWIYRADYSSEKELKGLVFEYIEVWYNKKRMHSALDYMSPEQYKFNNKAA